MQRNKNCRKFTIYTPLTYQCSGVVTSIYRRIFIQPSYCSKPSCSCTIRGECIHPVPPALQHIAHIARYPTAYIAQSRWKNSSSPFFLLSALLPAYATAGHLDSTRSSPSQDGLSAATRQIHSHKSFASACTRRRVVVVVFRYKVIYQHPADTAVRGRW